MLQKLLVASLCFVLLATFNGCTDGEIVASSIVVGGILVGSAIHDRDHYRPHHGYPGHHHGHGHYYYKNAENISDLVTPFAKRYQLTNESAMAIIEGIYSLERGDLSAVYQLGFSEDGLKNLALGKLVEDATIDQISLNLNVEAAKVKLILADFQKTITEQMKDVKSDYWQQCMVTGKWKTNYNSYCKDVNWSGCGPDSLPEQFSAKYVTCFAQ